MYVHPGTSEVLIVLLGSICAGFISSPANSVYLKNLNRGGYCTPNWMLVKVQHFPQSASAVRALGFKSLDFALFANDLPSELVEAATFLDDAQVKKLKGVLGGTG
ncbi:germin-like protein subfamily 3 member 3 [Syzygium oleosum]|uniref:germin-like protein subfamily 3 member 3 n=1 Tax=Syzygium oleosum TaxID=219896 RepID=UPI0024B9686A|nr:germin-like protein subfamily 3 member 3 [Syzygium oleosum]